MAGSFFAKLQTFVPTGEGFRPAGEGMHVSTCQRNNPAQARHKNEAGPAYIIPGIPMPCPPPGAKEQSTWQPNAPSSPPRHGFMVKAKAVVEKADEMKNGMHHKVSSILPGNYKKK